MRVYLASYSNINREGRIYYECKNWDEKKRKREEEEEEEEGFIGEKKVK